MSIETTSLKQDITLEDELDHQGIRLTKVERNTEFKWGSTHLTAAQNEVEASTESLRRSCQFAGECALSSECSVVMETQNEGDPLRENTSRDLVVKVSDDRLDCPQPNAHLMIMDSILNSPLT